MRSDCEKTTSSALKAGRKLNTRNMTSQSQMEKAPAIVDEQILAHAFDEVAEFTGDLMGKLTNVDAENEKAITMAHGIIYDGLLKEMISQINIVMLREADKRITKLFKK
jgi:hypothetical protein